MSAASDGARADARKRLAAAASAEALADALGDIRVAGARQADWWTNDTEHSLLIKVLRGECVPWAEGLLASDWLAGVIADAKAEAWDEGAAIASPYGGGYLRSFYAQNPYRMVTS